MKAVYIKGKEDLEIADVPVPVPGPGHERIAVEEDAVDVERATGLLRLFLANRWIGLWPILYGDQVRQTALDNWIYAGTLDVEHLPVPQQEVVR